MADLYYNLPSATGVEALPDTVKAATRRHLDRASLAFP